jgi:TetR/AcrR family transcriptional regulator
VSGPGVDRGGARRWGTASALLDDDEARRRLISATTRCIAARGTARITVEEVAREAGVARSTVYRYFKTRDDLVLGVVLERLDTGMARVVASHPQPDDAARSIVDLVMRSVGRVYGDEVNEALFSADSRWLVTSLEVGSAPVVDQLYRHLGPLLERWQADGQLHSDLDLRETTRWMNAVALLLLAPPWLDRSARAKRTFLQQYLVRALVRDETAR